MDPWNQGSMDLVGRWPPTADCLVDQTLDEVAHFIANDVILLPGLPPGAIGKGGFGLELLFSFKAFDF